MSETHDDPAIETPKDPRRQPWWIEYQVDMPEATKGVWSVKKINIRSDDLGLIIANLRMEILQREHRRVEPGTYTGLYRNGHEIMMSDTPAEIQDHLEVIQKIRDAGGRVLIAGLGLGMVLKAALTVPDVEHVDVVEIDPDIIHLVGPYYTHDPRVTIHHGDIFQIQFPVDAHWEVAWFDIWDSINPVYLEDMKLLTRKFAKKVDWSGCWSRDEIQWMLRRYKSSGV